MQATARMASVVSSAPCARRRLPRSVLPYSTNPNQMLPRFSIRTLMLLTVGAALTLLGIARVFAWPKIRSESFIRNHPVQTQINVHDGRKTIYSNRITYCLGDYGITEFGNIRIAIRGCTFTGRSSGGICLANDLSFEGGGSSTESGNSRFTESEIPGGSLCTFGGLMFEIINGKLKLLGEEFLVDGHDRLIIIDESGKIESSSIIG